MIIILKASARHLELPDNLIDGIVDLASDGQQALDMVRQRFFNFGISYDLIITDIQMPVLDGYQSAKMIREFHSDNMVPQPTIIACSGHTEQSYINKAWMHDIDEFLPKPIKIDVTIEILREFVR